MRRVLLCSLAVPWPSRPLLGIFHVHQARAVAACGGAMELFSPSPDLPAWLGKAWPRVRHQTERPERYAIDGVPVHAPRAAFAFPPVVRDALAPVAPRTVLRWADRAFAPSLDRAIASFGPDALLAHGIVPWGDAVAHAADRAGVPHAFIEHSADDLMRLRPGTRLSRACARAARRARAVFVVGPQMHDHAANVLGWENVVLLPNGALRATAPPPPRPSSLEGRRIVLAAANPYRRKGFEELVDAFGRVAASRPDAELHLVTTPTRSLRARLDACRARVVVHAPMAPQELLGWMAWADLFALPSWSEAFGLVYGEALAQGTPVLCTTDSGFWRYARQWSERGEPAPAIAVPPRDEDALAVALDVALAHPEPLEESARSGARMVDAWFSWERNARVLLEGLGARDASHEPRGARVSAAPAR